jgi:sphingolipid delta-4 desaturase
MSLDFSYDQEYTAHIRRAREIRAKYPEVRALMGTNPATAFWSVVLVLLQFCIGYGLANVSWIWVFVAAYLIGAFVNHALFVITHECTHNLVFRNSTYNKILGIFGDFALVVPGAIAFRKYHLLHHQYLGQYDMDPDIVSRTEGQLVGNSTLRKVVWVFLLGVSQALRPLKIKGVEIADRWFISNILAVVAVDILIFVFVGPKAVAYLALSTLFALGLHPVGGRWIQEHYTDGDGQETHSYYGPLNKLCFNMGYHNEHHDFASVPWNNLPKLKRLAPEYYDNLKSYRSWTVVLFRFISDKSMSTFSRIVHEPRERAPVVEDASSGGDNQDRTPDTDAPR